MPLLYISVDGASKGNPGDAGIGVVIKNEEGEAMREIGEYIGVATNNVAEYAALIRGLKEAKSLNASAVRISSDSELMVKQILGVYKVKSPHLLDYHREAKALLRGFQPAEIRHVMRNENKEADTLASKAAAKGAKSLEPTNNGFTAIPCDSE